MATQFNPILAGAYFDQSGQFEPSLTASDFDGTAGPGSAVHQLPTMGLGFLEPPKPPPVKLGVLHMLAALLALNPKITRRVADPRPDQE